MEFLCVVIDSDSRKTLAEYELSANNEPFAHWKAAKMFRETNPSSEVSWEIDALKLD